MKDALMRSAWLVLAIGIIVNCFGCSIYPKDTIAELKRNSASSLTAVTITGYYHYHPFSIPLKEPIVLEYLTTMLRDASDDVGSGMSFRIKLRLNDGTESELMLQLPEAGSQLYILVEKPFPSDGKEYCVTLVDPIPKELSDALLKIRTGLVTNEVNSARQP
jgi:hypothetical protein